MKGLTSFPPNLRFRPIALNQLVLVSLLVLPYVSYLGLAGLAIFLVIGLPRWGRAGGQILYRQGWLWLTLGIGLSVLMAQYPREAALESLNFWPFFGFYALLALAIPRFEQPVAVLHDWALGLLLATLPITLRAIVEFYFKAPGNLERWQGHPWFNWLYLQPDYGFRADSVFGHPNVLANYLVIVFGLGLGLCAYYLQQQWHSAQSGWVYGATALILVGIFCSGSRNGLLVAGLQILCFGWLIRRHRYLVLAALGAIAAMLVGALAWGVGGRSLEAVFTTTTLRLEVWQLAAQMVGQNPWLGSGLGSFRLQYQPYSIPIYDQVNHSHNLLLMLAAELGLPVMVGFLVIVGLIVFRGLRTLQPASPLWPQRGIFAAYLMGFGGAVAFTMFDLSFYDARVNVLGWLTLAVIQAMPQLAQAPLPLTPKKMS
ncbi:MAG TPA: O-antigen ligase family protein [Leptolyngbyaceae cyanobacterium M65_K2018_010]|nr:O-antigen ligase family protein [Leptolyngbyaceae cyanobacterium M65_K2018_010]